MSDHTHATVSFAVVFFSSHLTYCILKLIQVFSSDILRCAILLLAVRREKYGKHCQERIFAKEIKLPYFSPWSMCVSSQFSFLWYDLSHVGDLLAGDLKSWTAIWISTKASEITIIPLGIKLPTARLCVWWYDLRTASRWCSCLHKHFSY